MKHFRIYISALLWVVLVPVGVVSPPIAVFFLSRNLSAQRTVFYGQNVTTAPSGPTYQYIAAESGSASCTTCTTPPSVTATVNTVNGDLLVVNCQRLQTGSTAVVNVSDANGETWNNEAQLVPSTPAASGYSAVFVAVVANASTGDAITCARSGALTPTSLSMTVDAFRSSSGWTDQGDGTPTDQGTLNYVLASPAGPCTVTASGASVQANELVYGSCFATAGTVSAASGYTTAQNNTFASVGQVYTAYQPVTTIQTPTFTTNGILTDPQSLILTFAPN